MGLCYINVENSLYFHMIRFWWCVQNYTKPAIAHVMICEVIIRLFLNSYRVQARIQGFRKEGGIKNTTGWRRRNLEKGRNRNIHGAQAHVCHPKFWRGRGGICCWNCHYGVNRIIPNFLFHWKLYKVIQLIIFIMHSWDTYCQLEPYTNLSKTYCAEGVVTIWRKEQFSVYDSNYYIAFM
jgi:hypothetical protein